MSSYKIGLYNPRVETDELLKECDVIFNNFDDLKSKVEAGHEIILVSGFSIYEYNMLEMLELIESKELIIHIYNKSETPPSKAVAKLEITMLMGINNYIRESLSIIKKL